MKEDSYLSRIQRLEARILDLEASNLELQRQLRAVLPSPQRLSASTPAFHPISNPAMPDVAPNASPVQAQAVSPGSSAPAIDLVRMSERLSTLEGRQGSVQKKISSLDSLLGPSAAAWARSLAAARQRLGDDPLYTPPRDRERERGRGGGNGDHAHAPFVGDRNAEK